MANNEPNLVFMGLFPEMCIGLLSYFLKLNIIFYLLSFDEIILKNNH